MPTSHQEAAIKRLEEMFKNVNVGQSTQKPTKTSRSIVRVETQIDKCCEIHGKNHKANCKNGKAQNAKTTMTTMVTTAVVAPNNRRGSLNIPASPRPKDSHPSNFASTLRKDSAMNNNNNNSSSAIGKKDHHPHPPTSGLRRGSLNQSTSSLRSVSSTSSSVSSKTATTKTPISAKSAAKPINPKPILKRPAGRILANGTIAPVLSSTAKIKEKLSSSRGEARTSSGSSPSTTTRSSSSLLNSQKFSADSLENLAPKKITWDPERQRRGSVGSSGGYDDAIWEEDDMGTSVDDEVISVYTLIFIGYLNLTLLVTLLARPSRSNSKRSPHHTPMKIYNKNKRTARKDRVLMCVREKRSSFVEAVQQRRNNVMPPLCAFSGGAAAAAAAHCGVAWPRALSLEVLGQEYVQEKITRIVRAQPNKSYVRNQTLKPRTKEYFSISLRSTRQIEALLEKCNRKLYTYNPYAPIASKFWESSKITKSRNERWTLFSRRISINSPVRGDQVLADKGFPQVKTKIDQEDRKVHPVEIVIMSVNSKSELAQYLVNFRKSIYWNSHASLFIVDGKSGDHCSVSYMMLYIAWKFKMLNSLYLCKVTDNYIKLYTYNPYAPIASRFWRSSKNPLSRSERWTLFSRRIPFDFLVREKIDISARPRVIDEHWKMQSTFVKNNVGYIVSPSKFWKSNKSPKSKSERWTLFSRRIPFDFVVRVIVKFRARNDHHVVVTNKDLLQERSSSGDQLSLPENGRSAHTRPSLRRRRSPPQAPSSALALGLSQSSSRCQPTALDVLPPGATGQSRPVDDSDAAPTPPPGLRLHAQRQQGLERLLLSDADVSSERHADAGAYAGRSHVASHDHGPSAAAATASSTAASEAASVHDTEAPRELGLARQDERRRAVLHLSRRQDQVAGGREERGERVGGLQRHERQQSHKIESQIQWNDDDDEGQQRQKIDGKSVRSR
ncbi:unnamed protein product [Trichogramma brassicae]|uniref:Uncharacterized protein n=1 Tax=Trichogramma brassicae TaxID=86971 RepID=A0A6H5ILH3_9HYME|nr:unnamed protein product [Trichogramma brassicae]